MKSSRIFDAGSCRASLGLDPWASLRAGLRGRLSPHKLYRRIRTPFAACWLAVFFLFASFCSAEVLRVSINDAIQPVTAEYIGRALDVAAANHDQAVLIEINTPGGLVDSTREIIEKIIASPVPVIIYVTPSGSRAASAVDNDRFADQAAALRPRDFLFLNLPTSLPWLREPTLERLIPSSSAARWMTS